MDILSKQLSLAQKTTTFWQKLLLRTKYSSQQTRTSGNWSIDYDALMLELFCFASLGLRRMFEQNLFRWFFKSGVQNSRETLPS